MKPTNNNASPLAGIQSLKAVKQVTDIISRNIHNSEVPGASPLAHEISNSVSNGSFSGIKLDKVSRKINQLQTNLLYQSTSDKHKEDFKASITNRLSSIIEDRSITSQPGGAVDEVLDSLMPDQYTGSSYRESIAENRLIRDLSDMLALEERSISKQHGEYNLLSEIEKIVNRLSLYNEQINQVEEEIVDNIQSTLSSINTSLNTLYTLSTHRLTTGEGTLERAEIESRIHNELVNLSENIDINHFYDAEGILNISTKSGQCNIVGKNRSSLKYVSQETSDIKDAIYSCVENSNGDIIKQSPLFISYGANSNANGANISAKNSYFTAITGGKLGGILSAKEEVLAHTKETLQEMTQTIANCINNAHNSLSNKDGHDHFTSSKVTSLDQQLIASGSFSLHTIDTNGNTETACIKLSEINPNSKVVTTKQVLNEIDQLVNKGSKLSCAAFDDMQLAVINNDPASGLVLDLDITSHNFSADGAELPYDMTINAVRINSSASTVTEKLGDSFKLPLPTDTESAAPSRIRTSFNGGPKISISASDLVPGSNTVSISATITKPDGGQVQTTIDFNLGDLTTQSEIQNRRFSATSVSTATPDNSGFITINNTASSDMVRTSLVNDNMEHSQSGHLHIGTKDCKVALTDIDSSISGIIGSDTISNHSFLHFFGMNDIIVQKSDTLAPNAITSNKIMIRKDIDPNVAISTKQFGDIDGAYHNAFQSLKGEKGATLYQYIAEKVCNAHLSAHTAEAVAESSSRMNEEAIKTISEGSGKIDVLQEMSYLMALQNAYQSIAKTMQVSRELNKTLLDSF